MECYCCGQKIRSYNGMFKHLETQCQKLKINCQFCPNWYSREDFRNKDIHPCQEDIEILLDKFQGNVNKLIEEDTSEHDQFEERSETIEEQKNSEIGQLQNRLKVLERKNEILMGKSPNLNQLPLIIELLKIQKSKSFIDKKTCLNTICQAQYQSTASNYFGEIKMQLYKSDSDVSEFCKRCKNNRYCSIFECKHCESKFCYYCMIEASKRQVLQSLKIPSQTNILKPTAIVIQPPIVQITQSLGVPVDQIEDFTDRR